jgi:glutathione synthase/RimK-type ligase-like ATP-grasp enzyme
MGALRPAIIYDSITCDEIGIRLAAEKKGICLDALNFPVSVNILGGAGEYSPVMNRCQSKARRERASFILEEKGSRVINTFEVETICNSKIFTVTRFVKNGVKTVRTAYVPFSVEKEGVKTVYRPGDVKKVADEIELSFSYPFVVKPERGSRGRNVMLIEERKQLENILKNWARSLDSPAGLLVQEFVNKAFDLRIVVSSYDGVKHVPLASLARVSSSREDFATNTALGAVPIGVEVPWRIMDEAVKAAAAVSKTVSILGVDAIPRADEEEVEKVIDHAKRLVPVHSRVKRFKEIFSNSVRLPLEKFLEARKKMDEAFKEMINTPEYVGLKSILEEVLDDAEAYFIEANSRPDFYINTRNCTGVDVSDAYVKCIEAMF